MASEELGRLLLYVEGHFGPSTADLIELAALMQRTFPDHAVWEADVDWLRRAAPSLPVAQGSGVLS
jgi:hypothetical protein